MKTRKFFSALILLTAAIPLANAAEPEAVPPNAEHVVAMLEHRADTQSIMELAKNARTPAERNKLMAENMTVMKAHMGDMKKMGGMMNWKMRDGKPMPTAMDPTHMERMHQHIARMHEMMERLIVQQELMMKASANM